MSGVVVRVDTEETLGISELSQRAQRRVMKSAFDALGKFYVAKILKNRFKPGDEQRLGYPRRSAKYEERKRKWANRRWQWGKTGKTVKGGGRIANLLTGDFRDAVNRATYQAYPTRVTMTVAAPNYIKNRPKPGARHWIWGEINLRSSQEDQQIHDVLQEATQAAFLAEPRRRRRTRVS